MWGRPFRAAAGLLPGAPRAERTLAIHHKIGGGGSLYDAKLNSAKDDSH